VCGSGVSTCVYDRCGGLLDRWMGWDGITKPTAHSWMGRSGQWGRKDAECAIASLVPCFALLCFALLCSACPDNGDTDTCMLAVFQFFFSSFIFPHVVHACVCESREPRVECRAALRSPPVFSHGNDNAALSGHRRGNSCTSPLHTHGSGKRSLLGG